MISSEAFERLWQQTQDVDATWTPPPTDDDRCVFAQQYATWAEQAYRALPDPPTIDEIHRVILLNTLKYFEFRGVVPKAHRDLTSDRGHTCIFHIFEETFQLLKFTILSLPAHTTLLLPKPAQTTAPEKQVRKSTGIYIGEDLGFS